MNSAHRVGASYRDPAGFVFQRDGQIFRQINRCSKEDFESLIQSGLYRALTESRQLIPHEEADVPLAETEAGWKVIRPQRVEFISYPYEWCFSQLKDAALATLAVQKQAMRHGMSLKDASAYNIQFHQGRPIFIDTLSFERYEEGAPWPAYRQMCQHFLEPLALMAMRDIGLGQLLRVHLDGIPLDLASTLLPASSWLKLSLAAHVHLHARMHRKHAWRTDRPAARKSLGRTQLLGIIDSIESAIHRLAWKPTEMHWAGYYMHNSYSPAAMADKQARVSAFLEAIAPKTVWDLGANTGQFSRLSSDRGVMTIAFEADPAAVEVCYLQTRQRDESHLLPLLMDLTNPSPALGWDLDERLSLIDRGPADAIMALALIHHLAIAANIPLERVARFLHRIGRSLIIEFVPKDDPQVARLLLMRKDIFDHYTPDTFESAFARWFTIERRQPIADCRRMLYLMRRREET